MSNTVRDDRYWRQQLSRDQYRICRQRETEAPFSGEYCQHWQPGCYHCVCCGLPLFAADNKFESGCGWPSFDAPQNHDSVVSRDDRSLGVLRQEVLCAHCGAHLGHVFEDGSTPTGLRYCINSLALKFK